jgi:hypothetical protein
MACSPCCHTRIHASDCTNCNLACSCRGLHETHCHHSTALLPVCWQLQVPHTHTCRVSVLICARAVLQLHNCSTQQCAASWQPKELCTPTRTQACPFPDPVLVCGQAVLLGLRARGLRRRGRCCRRSSKTRHRIGWQLTRICAPKTPCPCSSKYKHAHISIPSCRSMSGHVRLRSCGCTHMQRARRTGLVDLYCGQAADLICTVNTPLLHSSCLKSLGLLPYTVLCSTHSPGGQILFIVAATLGQYR